MYGLEFKKCDRCGEHTTITTGSWFNQEMICQPCDKKERVHQMFETAKRAEREAVLQGDYNFPGIGKPHDL
jgi:recombinational DNA repair protein (RecF pathway)